MIRFTLVISLLLFSMTSLLSQNQLVIDDRSSLLSPEAERQIGEKLTKDGLSYTRMVDYSKRCTYYFAALLPQNNSYILKVSDCNDKVLGERNLGSGISSAPAEEKAFLISYNIREILKQPGKYLAGPPAQFKEEEVTPSPVKPPSDSALANEHNTRYFFAPSAYNLKKGELYYNTLYFLIHDIQYGFSDMFSMGMGTTVMGLPLYFTPKLSFPLGEKSALALGDLLMFGTWGTDFMGNLAYGTFSHGGSDGNFTLGAGHLYTTENDITGQTSSLVSNFSAMTRISPYIFFLTENYVMSANFNHDAWYEQQTEPGYWNQVEEEFTQRNTFWYGIVGIRIVSKNRDFVSWQMGLTYILNFPGNIPSKYLSWHHDAQADLNLIAFPTVSFTRKFGKNF